MPPKRAQQAPAQDGNVPPQKKHHTGRHVTPTVTEIVSDRITQTANQYWAPGASKLAKFDSEIIEDMYKKELARYSYQRVMLLEFSCYLENYLWPNFDPATATFAHVMSIIHMVNEKFREGVAAWTAFHDQEEAFTALFHRILNLWNGEHQMTLKERESYLLFLIHVFQSLEDAMVRRQALRLLSLPLWHSLNPVRLQRELEASSQLQKHWKALKKREDQLTSDLADPKISKEKLAELETRRERDTLERTFMVNLIRDMLVILESVSVSPLLNTPPEGLGKTPGSKQSLDVEDESSASEAAVAERKSLEREDAALKMRVSQLEHFLQLLIDLLSELPTRRFFHSVVQDSHVMVRCQMSPFASSLRGKRFGELLTILQFYTTFEIDNHTGQPLTDSENIALHSHKLQLLQRIAFKEFPELRAMGLSHIGGLETRKGLSAHLKSLPLPALRRLCEMAGLIGPSSASTEEGSAVSSPAHAHDWHHPETREFLMEILCAEYTKKPSQIESINELSLFQTEKVLWNDAIVPDEEVSFVHKDQVLPLPKLNLQFLTIHDYLLRNFTLFRLESAYEIREDIEDAVKRMQPFKDQFKNETIFQGWSKMAVPLQKFEIKKVGQPRLGEIKPSRVLAEITYSLKGMQGRIRTEWGDEFRMHDVLFLLTIRARYPRGASVAEIGSLSFPERWGIDFVRGAEVRDIMDGYGNVYEENVLDPTKTTFLKGDQRSLLCWMDTAQYEADQQDIKRGGEDPYKTFNIIVRRKAKENNFKAVLETVRDLMNAPTSVPSWLSDIFLGYGDPAAAQGHLLRVEQGRVLRRPVAPPPSKKKKKKKDKKGKGKDKEAQADAEDDASFHRSLDFRDTFLDWSHVKGSFPHHKVVTASGVEEHQLRPPFILQFSTKYAPKPVPPPEDSAAAGQEEKAVEEVPVNDDPHRVVTVTPYVAPYPGPYAYNKPRRNKIRFTAAQVQAIQGGLQPGLTMIVGPPGTGKTDVAVQIVQTLYHNFPEQKILMVTHSNQALNQLFEKIMELDIDERHLLRLGHGEEMLETEKDFSKWGRINYMLSRRIEMLQEVDRLAKSLNVTHYQVSQSCETAGHFFEHHIHPRWDKFARGLEQARMSRQTADDATVLDSWVVDHFPFHEYFSNAPQPVFVPEAGLEIHGDIAAGCWRHIAKVFEELKDMRAFELLKNAHDRSIYMLAKQARIIALTCTHAAITRRKLIDIDFKYDTIVMEEAAQILEVETFVPMLLQQPEPGSTAGAGSIPQTRLKRVVMLGDHNQLPPVVKNMAFQKYGHLDQSLFARFVRLGVPSILLDRQGRARPSIAELYNWRYKRLGNLPVIHMKKEYEVANPGFAYDYQLINVEDLNGVGESTPNPYFYQNLAEAEYMVSVYMYMRMIGYPKEKISMITTYNGQKHLLRDVVGRRCRDPIFGFPKKITTVDRFQGQENDIILLSLVRTKNVGHLRDVRRLVVAMSRARLGLYVFGREKLFANCYELIPTFSVLKKRPTKLVMSLGETHPTSRLVENPGNVYTCEDVLHMSVIVQSMFQERVKAYMLNQERVAREYEAALEKAKADALIEAEAREAADRAAEAKAAAESSSSTAENDGDKTSDGAATDGDAMESDQPAPASDGDDGDEDARSTTSSTDGLGDRTAGDEAMTESKEE